MRTQQSGLILNITSIAGYMGLPFRGIYSASKGALELITEAYRMELKAFNIKLTNIAPGDFATNIAAGRYHAPVTQRFSLQRTLWNHFKFNGFACRFWGRPLIVGKNDSSNHHL